MSSRNQLGRGARVVTLGPQAAYGPGNRSRTSRSGSAGTSRERSLVRSLELAVIGIVDQHAAAAARA